MKSVVTKSHDQGNLCIVIGVDQPVQYHFTLGFKHEEWPRPQMDENMTCNPTCHEMDHDHLDFVVRQPQKGCLAGFLGWPSHPNKSDWFFYIIF
jgi:hypothetical protein